MTNQIPHTIPDAMLTLSRYELFLVIDFLLTQDTVLRRKFKGTVPFSDYDRRCLVTAGLRIRKVLAHVLSIVKPETLLAWNRNMKRKKWTFDHTAKVPGRPRKDPAVEFLILRLAEENHWGYDRIVGELLKLGHQASPEFVRQVLKAHGFPPSSKRRNLSWKQFLSAHWNSLWAADFFTEEVWTLTGLTTVYILFFIQLNTRRVHIAGCTTHPNALWMKKQAELFVNVLPHGKHSSPLLIHDRDALFKPFDAAIPRHICRIVKTPPHAPQCNAYAERFIRSARVTLDQFILLGECHLWNVLKAIERHHNYHRPHQGIDNRIPLDYPYPDLPAHPPDVACESALGGLLNHYFVKERAA